MHLCVLGSGSSGNASVLRLGSRCLLIDAGFGPRTMTKRLADLGLSLADLDAVLLTHLDTDHFQPTWFTTLLKLNIRVYCHQRHLAELYQHTVATPGGADARMLHRAGLLHPFTDIPFTLTLADGSTARVTPVNLAHDREGTTGYRIDAPTGRLGFATDLGRVTRQLVETFANVDLLAIESNYDPPMQRASARPAMLKRRIMGGSGHLSNEQAMDGIREIAARSKQPPRHIVLLHLSRQCNCPQRILELYGLQPHLAERICITNQHARTPWLSADETQLQLDGQQLHMW
ncbi:MAG: MBL fold metallo-hydrolase [Planctomycetes bacterium]|nr:MBL fold metallo-hydrolase [Planctomycetota bacterium]